ncbi:MAG: hypothetical protein ABGZ53_23215 [Fuerstiella sp.]
MNEELRRNYAVKLNQAAAELVADAFDPGESPSDFLTAAMVSLAMRRRDGRWPAKIPAEFEPRKAGRPRKPRLTSDK